MLVLFICTLWLSVIIATLKKIFEFVEIPHSKLLNHQSANNYGETVYIIVDFTVIRVWYTNLTNYRLELLIYSWR